MITAAALLVWYSILSTVHEINSTFDEKKRSANNCSNCDADLLWREVPHAWHQQIARIVDHKFQNFSEFAKFSRIAKQAGVSVVNLVNPHKTAACPGSWYGGLQLCEHINGTFPARDGTLPVSTQQHNPLQHVCDRPTSHIHNISGVAGTCQGA